MNRTLRTAVMTALLLAAGNSWALEMCIRDSHDPCVGIRATPICEAMLALVLMDQALRHRAQCGDVGEMSPRIAGNINITDTKR